jgi:hypothetical protein
MTQARGSCGAQEGVTTRMTNTKTWAGGSHGGQEGRKDAIGCEISVRCVVTITLGAMC